MAPSHEEKASTYLKWEKKIKIIYQKLSVTDLAIRREKLIKLTTFSFSFSFFLPQQQQQQQKLQEVRNYSSLHVLQQPAYIFHQHPSLLICQANPVQQGCLGNSLAGGARPTAHIPTLSGGCVRMNPSAWGNSQRVTQPLHTWGSFTPSEYMDWFQWPYSKAR